MFYELAGDTSPRLVIITGEGTRCSDQNHARVCVNMEESWLLRLHGTERQIFGSLDLGRIRAVKYRRRVPGIHNKIIFQLRLHDGAARAGEGQQYATCVGTSGVKN